MLIYGILFIVNEKSMDQLASDCTDRSTEPVKIRRRKNLTRQLSMSSSSALSASAASIVGCRRKNKNAVMLLNELQPGGLRFDEVTKSGPDHKPVYTANVAVYGQVNITCAFYLVTKMTYPN